MYPEKPILMIDDESDWLNSLALSLKVSAGINHVEKCSDSRGVASRLKKTSYSLVLLDLTMPYIGGEELLGLISEHYPELPVGVISGLNQIDTAIRCVKAGAEDFYVKTDDRERVVAGISRILKQSQLQQENRQLAETLLRQDTVTHPAFAGLVTANSEMLAIFAYLQAIAQSSEPVLISGESGVGKELIARALHQICCPGRPWVAVNVAGLDDTVFADTLFGHVKGAYTGAERDRAGMIEQAQNGILFLDEIGDLSIASQIKLLRLLQEGEYYPLGSDRPRKIKARILVASNQNLQEKEAKGEFRRDLLYRLWAHRVAVPPLRERKDDMGLLLQHFLTEAARSLGKKKPTSPPELVTLLATHSFPGNIRELRAMVFNAVSLHRGGVLSMSSFKAALPAAVKEGCLPVAKAGRGAGVKVQFMDELPSLKEVSTMLVAEALARAQGNRSIAARMLGISHQALSKRLKKAD